VRLERLVIMPINFRVGRKDQDLVARVGKISLDQMTTMGGVEPSHRRIDDRRQRVSRCSGQSPKHRNGIATTVSSTETYKTIGCSGERSPLAKISTGLVRRPQRGRIRSDSDRADNHFGRVDRVLKGTSTQTASSEDRR
jgi:hypothetical protein